MHHRCRTRERPDNPAPACEDSQVAATATKRPREKRRHSALAYLSPMEFEQQHRKTAKLSLAA